MEAKKAFRLKLEPSMEAILRQKNARIRCRVGFAGQQVKAELLPFGGENGLQTGQLEP